MRQLLLGVGDAGERRVALEGLGRAAAGESAEQVTALANKLAPADRSVVVMAAVKALPVAEAKVTLEEVYPLNAMNEVALKASATAYQIVASRLANESGLEAMAWLAGLPSELSTQVSASVFTPWSAKSSEAVAKWLTENTNSPHYKIGAAILAKELESVDAEMSAVWKRESK